MLTSKQEKFVLARIAVYDERLKALETRIQTLDGGRIPEMVSAAPVYDKRPDEQD
jgi:hypothetical protein